jgi:hypothetical protein
MDGVKLGAIFIPEWIQPVPEPEKRWFSGAEWYRV